MKSSQSGFIVGEVLAMVYVVGLLCASVGGHLVTSGIGSPDVYELAKQYTDSMKLEPNKVLCERLDDDRDNFVKCQMAFTKIRVTKTFYCPLNVHKIFGHEINHCIDEQSLPKRERKYKYANDNGEYDNE